ncbi:MAG: hypothetical protein AAB489_00535 [Patescibacteria group bacterium]
MQNTDSFFGFARSFGLTPDEKHQMRSVLQDFMEYGSVRSASDARHQMVMTSLTSFIEAAKEVRLSAPEKQESLQSVLKSGAPPAEPSEGAGFLGRITLPEPHFAPIFASVLLMAIVAGVATGVAAEDALPGDFLYAIKVVIHEPLIAGTAFSEARRARIEATLAARRLEEAEELALRSRLDIRIAEDLSRGLLSHAGRFRQSIVALREGGQVEEAETLDSEWTATILAQEAALVHIAHERQNLKREIAVVIQGIDDQVLTMAGSEQVIEIGDPETGLTRAPVISSNLQERKGAGDDRRISRTKEKIEESRKAVEAAKGVAGTEALLWSEEKLHDAEALLSDAERELLRGNADDALLFLTASMRQAEEAKQLVRVSAQLKQTDFSVSSANAASVVKSARQRLTVEVHIRIAATAIRALKEALQTQTDAMENTERSRSARRQLLAARDVLEKSNKALELDQWQMATKQANKATTIAEKARLMLLDRDPLEFGPDGGSLNVPDLKPLRELSL